MERDFMGLNSVLKKEEAHDACKHPDGFRSFNNHQIQHESKQAVPVTMNMNSPYFRPRFSGAPVNRRLLKGVPIPVAFPSIEPWNSSKDSAQLTVFYGGMVNVYDGISPEKAQAIMFMAGNGAFVPTNPRAQAQGPTQLCSPVSSPMSVSSHPVGQLTTQAAKRVISSLGQAMQSAIPQARKASLARFLEKRKERMMAAAPYNTTRKIIDCTAIVASQ